MYYCELTATLNHVHEIASDALVRCNGAEMRAALEEIQAEVDTLITEKGIMPLASPLSWERMSIAEIMDEDRR